MERLSTLTYDGDGRVARVTLDRPERGNALTLDTPRELAECVERANDDPAVHVIALAGRGKGFCGGYDLKEFAERGMPNHDPDEPCCSTAAQMSSAGIDVPSARGETTIGL